MGDITYVDLPSKDDDITKDEDFGALESVKASSELLCPVSGTIVAVNEKLEDAPELINEDPYANWIIKVEMSDASELNSLLTAAAYAEIIK
jgi:glycine cleavage system H protein